MAIQSNEFTSNAAIGIREDLTDMIHTVAQEDTPFLQSIGASKATATRHDWQTDALATPADAPVLEGDTLALNAITPTVRLYNYTQVQSKQFAVSVTEQIVRKAGRQDEMAYQQVFKFGKEIYRDMERTAVGTNRAWVAGDNTTTRKAAGVLPYIKTNVSKASDGSNPNGTGSNARTDGTVRTLTQSLLLDVMQLCYQNGGKPNLLLASPFNVVQMQKFDNNTTKMTSMPNKGTLGGTIDAIQTPFGLLAIKPDIEMRSAVYSDTTSELLVLDTNFWKKAMLHDFMVREFARTADSENPRQLRIEWTLEASNEKSSGIVADLAVS